MKKVLGIIAGGGELPKILAHYCTLQGSPYVVLALKGYTTLDWVGQHPHHWAMLGQIREALDFLKAHHVTQLVFAGHIKRPSLKSLKMDVKALEWVAHIGLKAFGDDGLLTGIIQQFEKEGFQVVGAQDVVSSLLMPKGVLGNINPLTQDKEDIHRGFEAAKLLGQADIGQAVIVENGVVLSVEGIEGTDALLKRTQELKREPKSGVLVKVCKPQQEMRIDLPTIGLDTLKAAASIGLKGIALEAGKGIFLQQDACIRWADENGLFLYGIG